jgi:hypothetical protein
MNLKIEVDEDNFDSYLIEWWDPDMQVNIKTNLFTPSPRKTISQASLNFFLKRSSQIL